jgi:hypothetical protein
MSVFVGQNLHFFSRTEGVDSKVSIESIRSSIDKEELRKVWGFCAMVDEARDPNILGCVSKMWVRV